MSINLTTTSYLVLGLVARSGSATPYDLKQAVFHTIEYFWAFPHSQLYAEPERLKNAGYLIETRERVGRRRRTFTITEKGREALAAWLQEPTEDLIEIRDLGLLKLYFGELGSQKNVMALAEQQTDLHRERLSEYERLCAERQDTDATKVYPLAVLEMGLLFERAALAFWTAVAAHPPGVGHGLQPRVDFEDLSGQITTRTQRTRSKKTQRDLSGEIESQLKNIATSEAPIRNDSFERVMNEEVEELETRNLPQENLPDHLL
jgi:DNA-binding PadR family transcriptional regulator